MKLLILFAVFYATLAHQPQDLVYDLTAEVISSMPMKAAYVACTDEKFLYCQTQFNSFIGYNGKWSDVKEFQHAINTFYKQDVSGLLSLCHARTMLYICFGTQYESCTSRIQFLKKGANVTEAYQISGIFNSLDFECSGGSIQATQNWGCIYAKWNDQQYINAKNACLTAFYANTFNNLNQVCVAGQGLALCLSNQFVGLAPPCDGADLPWFECQRIVDYFQFDGNCPNIKCTVKTSNSFQPKTPEQALRLGLTHNAGLAAIHVPSKRHRN